MQICSHLPKQSYITSFRSFLVLFKTSEVYLGPLQTSMTEAFARIGNGQKHPPEVFYKKEVFLKNSQNSQENTFA